MQGMDAAQLGQDAQKNQTKARSTKKSPAFRLGF